MRKFFFPFAKKYKGLSKHAWHRVAIVVYWIIIAASLYGIWILFQAPEVSELNNCYQAAIELTPGISPEALSTQCNVFEPTTGFNFLAAIIGTLIISYLIQLIYYKVLLWVILGKNIPEKITE